MTIIDIIRERTDIEKLIGEYIFLSKAGDNYVALCPFHNENTESFVVFPDDRTWECFGTCRASGDAFDFLMRYENIDYKEAAEKLADRIGLELSEYDLHELISSIPNRHQALTIADIMEGKDDDPDLPLPDRIIRRLGGYMEVSEDDYGQRLYCVRDWVYHASGSKAKQRHMPWKNLRASIDKQGDLKVGQILTPLSVSTAGGPQTMDFAYADGLYQITIRMDDKSETVRLVKSFLADAGVIVDNIRLEQQSFIRNNLSDPRRAMLIQAESLLGNALAEMLFVVAEQYFQELIKEGRSAAKAMSMVKNAVESMSSKVVDKVILKQLTALGLPISEAKRRVELMAPVIAAYAARAVALPPPKPDKLDKSDDDYYEVGDIPF